MTRYQKKIITILSTLLFLYVMYLLNDLAIYTWFCNEEDNGASCMVTSLKYEELSDKENSVIFLNKSCDLKYGPACYKKSLRFEDNSDTSKLLLNKSCNLGYEIACEKIKK